MSSVGANELGAERKCWTFVFLFLCTGWTSSFSTWRRPASGWVGLTSTRREFGPMPRWSSSNLSSPSTACQRTPTPRPLRRAWACRKQCERNQHSHSSVPERIQPLSVAVLFLQPEQSSDCTDLWNEVETL